MSTNLSFTKQTVQNVRTGTASVVTPTNITKKSSNNFTVDVGLAHWMKAQNIDFNIAGLQPQQTHYAFFDNVPISNLCAGPDIIELYSSTTNKFIVGEDLYFPTGAATFLHRDNNIIFVSDVRGTILPGDTCFMTYKSNNICVVANHIKLNGKVIDSTWNTVTLDYGSFLYGSGVISTLHPTYGSYANFMNTGYGAKIKIVHGTGIGQIRTINSYNKDTRIAWLDKAWETLPDKTSIYSMSALYTDRSGTLVGRFYLPNEMFNTGQKTFRFTSDPNNNKSATSYAEKQFFSQGLLQDKSFLQLSTMGLDNSLQTVSESQPAITYVSDLRLGESQDVVPPVVLPPVDPNKGWFVAPNSVNATTTAAADTAFLVNSTPTQPNSNPFITVGPTIGPTSAELSDTNAKVATVKLWSVNSTVNITDTVTISQFDQDYNNTVGASKIAYKASLVGDTVKVLVSILVRKIDVLNALSTDKIRVTFTPTGTGEYNSYHSSFNKFTTAQFTNPLTYNIYKYSTDTTTPSFVKGTSLDLKAVSYDAMITTPKCPLYCAVVTDMYGVTDIIKALETSSEDTSTGPSVPYTNAPINVDFNGSYMKKFVDTSDPNLYSSVRIDKYINFAVYNKIHANTPATVSFPFTVTTSKTGFTDITVNSTATNYTMTVNYANIIISNRDSYYNSFAPNKTIAASTTANKPLMKDTTSSLRVLDVGTFTSVPTSTTWYNRDLLWDVIDTSASTKHQLTWFKKINIPASATYKISVILSKAMPSFTLKLHPSVESDKYDDTTTLIDTSGTYSTNVFYASISLTAGTYQIVCTAPAAPNSKQSGINMFIHDNSYNLLQL